jgi:hypothetical protein
MESGVRTVATTMVQQSDPPGEAGLTTLIKRVLVKRAKEREALRNSNM